MHIRLILYGLILFGLTSICHAQNSSDSAFLSTNKSNKNIIKKHSAKTATLLSLALPGAGQVYNKKNWWWKVPIIYATAAGLAYGIGVYHNEYKEFADAYRIRLEQKSNNDPRYDRYQDNTLKAIRDSYRESRDLFIIYMVLGYAAQVVDASVEAHFLDFDMSDNVSLNTQPIIWVQQNTLAVGVKFSFNLK
jgi:hypothetical protein